MMKPPKGLSAEAKRIWTSIEKEWKLNRQEVILLQQALENFDQMREAQAIIKKEGLILEDEKMRKYLHPAATWEKTCKNNFQRFMKQIGFMEGIKKNARGVGRPTDSEREKNGDFEDD